MKEIYHFIKWQLNKWSLDELLYFTAAGLFGCSIVESDKETSALLLRIAITMIVLLLLKWTVWESTRRSWRRYKQEKRDLFKTIDQGK
jgi:hypothetical protein